MKSRLRPDANGRPEIVLEPEGYAEEIALIQGGEVLDAAGEWVRCPECKGERTRLIARAVSREKELGPP